VSPRKLPGAWLKIRILNSICVLLVLVKSLQNRRKRKNANSILLDSW
jgi:hypothetical protein